MPSFNLLRGDVSASEVTEPLQVERAVYRGMTSQFPALIIASGRLGALAVAVIFSSLPFSPSS